MYLVADSDGTKPSLDTNEFQDTNAIFSNNLEPQQASFNVIQESEETLYPSFQSVNPLSISATSKDCQNRNYAPHESDCNKYYICQHGTLLEQR